MQQFQFRRLLLSPTTPGTPRRFQHMYPRPSIDLTPPPYQVSLQQPLDRTVFQKALNVLAVRTSVSQTGRVLKAVQLKGALLNIPKVRSVIPDPADPYGHRLVPLRICEEAELSLDAQDFLRTETNGLVPFKVILDYEHWNVDEILHVLLPPELRQGSPTSFSSTGHIAHVNLREEYLPYKHLIAQVILDKNKRITTVVNKLDSIDSKFRFFKMELLAGEPNYVVQHRESNCTFTFDFTEVYWNSRLHTEHERLVQTFCEGDVIADVFAGVGPFAIPAAKKGCPVFANDLNPSSAKYLALNVKKNQAEDYVRVFCQDGRDFIRSVIFESPFSVAKSTPVEKRGMRQVPHSDTFGSRISHFVMNLPDTAIHFLDAFRGILAPAEFRDTYDIMPMIHCYCFTREVEPDRAATDIIQRVKETLGAQVTDAVNFHRVRSVAPNKEMYCISFRLPSEVAFATN